MTQLVSTPAFWKGRIEEANTNKRDLFTAIFNTTPAIWYGIQVETAKLLNQELKPGMKLLDAGCGYGIVYELISSRIHYTGIDISPDFIELARLRYRSKSNFVLGDIRSLAQYKDNVFDLALCRSIRDMMIDNGLEKEWQQMAVELLRVAKRLLIVEYVEPVSIENEHFIKSYVY